ncbi:MAG: hypothetical protein V4510_05215 [bacterium]
MRDEALIHRLRRARDRSRTVLLVAFVALLIFGVGFTVARVPMRGVQIGNLSIDLANIQAGIIVVAVAALGASLVAWAYFGWRLHRVADPWAYDPDLDGPDPKRPRDLGDGKPPQ